MAELGLDPLTIMTDFGKRQQMEIFWSFRMNDVHDKSRQIPYEAARFRFNKLKNEHPEHLLGATKKRLKHGGWSGADSGRPKSATSPFVMWKRYAATMTWPGWSWADLILEVRH